jgi:2,4-dienoyl-CoA reductase-like NADH-dependent reductase (Old Yellow Enzyme family)
MTILLTPARIGGVAIKDRIVMPPMTTRTADDDGSCTDGVSAVANAAWLSLRMIGSDAPRGRKTANQVGP